jgi:putative transposase
MSNIIQYTKSYHCKYRLAIHLIFVVKYRKKLLTNLGSVIRSKIIEISSYSNFDTVNLETDKDHLHMLISYPPKISVVQIVKRLKLVLLRIYGKIIHIIY